MFDTNKYLADQFRKYFPDCGEVDVHEAEDETITVNVHFDDRPTSTWFMEIGSDDDWYEFTNIATENRITFPFAPEQYAEAE